MAFINYLREPSMGNPVFRAISAFVFAGMTASPAEDMKKP